MLEDVYNSVVRGAWCVVLKIAFGNFKLAFCKFLFIGSILASLVFICKEFGNYLFLLDKTKP